MKNRFVMSAALMMAAAMANDTSIFDTGRRRRIIKPVSNVELTKREKCMLHQENEKHEFVIHGEKIMARNKKTAMKIYANRKKK